MNWIERMIEKDSFSYMAFGVMVYVMAIIGEGNLESVWFQTCIIFIGIYRIIKAIEKVKLF